MQELIDRGGVADRCYFSHTPRKRGNLEPHHHSCCYRVRSRESREMIQPGCKFFYSVGKKHCLAIASKSAQPFPYTFLLILESCQAFCFLPLQTGARNTCLPFGYIKGLRKRTLYPYIAKNGLCFQAALHAFTEAPAKDVTAVGYRPLLCYAYLCWPH